MPAPNDRYGFGSRLRSRSSAPVEDGTVAVRRPEQHGDLLAALELDAVDLDRLEHPPLEQRQRRVEPEQLLDGGRHELGLRAQARQRLGMPEERPPAVAGAVDRSLVPRVEQQDAGGDQLPLGQRVAVVDDRRQAADEVVAGMSAPVGEKRAQVVAEFDARLDGLARRRLRRVELVHQADVRRPRPQVMAIRLGDPEQLGDDRHRQRFDIVGDEVDLAGARDLRRAGRRRSPGSAHASPRRCAA